MRLTAARRNLLLLTFLGALGVLTACESSEQLDGQTEVSTSQTEVSTTSAAGDNDRLIVADYEGSTIYVYSVPEYELLATLEDVRMEDHAGFLPLDDGRILFADRASSELVALDFAAPTPAIDARAAIPGRAIHLAVDPDREYVAVSTAAAESGTSENAITLIDLGDFTVAGQVELESAEPGVILGPGAVIHRDGEEQGKVESFALADVTTGGANVASTAEVGAWGHGEAFGSGHAFVATDDGLEMLHVSGADLKHEGVIPWDVDGREGGRAYYARVVDDESPHLWSYLRNQESDTWGEWENDIYVVDLTSGQAHRAPLGNGLAFRLAVSDTRALYARMHPDGYVAHIVDADPDSESFMATLHEIELAMPTQAPAADDDLETVWFSPGRPITAVTTDGAIGFVSRGSDGIVDVIDTHDGSIVHEIELPTSLDGGGYLAAARLGSPVVDTLGR